MSIFAHCYNNEITFITEINECYNNEITVITETHECYNNEITFITETNECYNNEITFVTETNEFLSIKLMNNFKLVDFVSLENYYKLNNDILFLQCTVYFSSQFPAGIVKFISKITNPNDCF